MLFSKTICAACVQMEDTFLVYDWEYHRGKRVGKWQINYLIQARLLLLAFNSYLVYLVTLDLLSCRSIYKSSIGPSFLVHSDRAISFHCQRWSSSSYGACFMVYLWPLIYFLETIELFPKSTQNVLFNFQILILFYLVHYVC